MGPDVPLTETPFAPAIVRTTTASVGVGLSIAGREEGPSTSAPLGTAVVTILGPAGVQASMEAVANCPRQPEVPGGPLMRSCLEASVVTMGLRVARTERGSLPVSGNGFEGGLARVGLGLVLAHAETLSRDAVEDLKTQWDWMNFSVCGSAEAAVQRPTVAVLLDV